VGTASAGSSSARQPPQQQQPQQQPAAAAPQQQRITTYKGKLVLLGDINVGKTSIVTRCGQDRFIRNCAPTIGVAFSQKAIEVEGAVVKLDVWDSAGEERFRSINSLYYHGAAAGIIVFDVTNRASFENAVSYWVPHLREHGSARLVVALVGNKCDTPAAAHRVTAEEGAEYARREGLLFFMASAKTGRNVGECFRALAREVPSHLPKPGQDGFRITGVDTAGSRLNFAPEPAGRRCC
jgi:small GTP-binding protein